MACDNYYSSISIHFLILFLVLSLISPSCFSLALQRGAPGGFALPVVKDRETHLYYTWVSIGTPLHPMGLAIDLSARILWYDCNTHYNSSSYKPIICFSKECPDPPFCRGCDTHDFKPGCTDQTCGIDIDNPFALYGFFGDRGKDVISLASPKHPQISPPMTLGCIDSDLIGDNRAPTEVTRGLPKATKGVLGLSKYQLAFPTQYTSAYKLPRNTFGFCLPSSFSKPGKFFIGGALPHYWSQFLTLTIPFVINPESTTTFMNNGPSIEYFIDVKSILIDGERVNLKPSVLAIQKNGDGGTKFDTMTNFTSLHNTVYGPVIRQFLKKASEKKMKRVGSVAPFEACFDATSIPKRKDGLLDVPTIDLELQGGVKWSIHAPNSMVWARRGKVVCLAFLNAGKVQYPHLTSILIGAHTLEDHVLEFDLTSSKLSFSTNLLLHNTTCSHSTNVTSDSSF